VAVAVRNEAQRLPRLLESLAEFRSRGGEVVVVDTGSEDGTPEVARAAGCRVAIEPRRFNGRLTEKQARRINESFCLAGEGPIAKPGERLFRIARARNFAASLARRSFILTLDGGDTVEAMDVAWIDASIQEGRFPAYQFDERVWNSFGWSVELHDCLYDRRLLAWEGRSHNFLAPLRPAASRPQGRLSRAQLLVSHHSDLNKPRGYQIAGTALEALRHPGSVRWNYFLGRELLSRGCFQSALPLLLGLDRPEAPPAVRSAALCFAARCVAASNAARDEVDTLLIRAAARDSTRRDPLLLLARQRIAAGDLQGAASFASAALAISPRTGISEPEENHSVGPHAILYWALLWLGRRDEAKTHFDICRRLDPESPIYLEHERFFTAT
jgi:hypothetical protein